MSPTVSLGPMRPAPVWLRNPKATDDKGNVLMTKDYLKYLCKKQQLYSTPELNDKLYLQYQGFTNMENLDAYVGLKSLWLDGNGVSKIENIDQLSQLRCLYPFFP